ncbi:hypothetical protein PITC_045110 [Penicillium italicum]|uniref:Uncharacterized protein n=1 Tax=Penicillium italicum TaxID=40296 RepID=A0A0A2KTZ1_PENIT|nr:hypothetical protein PITC_045110 [Penicillium italicum]
MFTIFTSYVVCIWRRTTNSLGIAYSGPLSSKHLHNIITRYSSHNAA